MNVLGRSEGKVALAAQCTCIEARDGVAICSVKLFAPGWNRSAAVSVRLEVRTEESLGGIAVRACEGAIAGFTQGSPEFTPGKLPTEH